MATPLVHSVLNATLEAHPRGSYPQFTANPPLSISAKDEDDEDEDEDEDEQDDDDTPRTKARLGTTERPLCTNCEVWIPFSQNLIILSLTHGKQCQIRKGKCDRGRPR